MHHSAIPIETDSNFGFNLAFLDRLFGTYKPLPQAGHDAMTIGLERLRDETEQRVEPLIMQPFRRH